jgi:hypothetical protein
MTLLLDYLLTTRFLNCTFSILALTEVAVKRAKLKNITRARLNPRANATISHHSQLGSIKLRAIPFLGLGVQTQGIALH